MSYVTADSIRSFIRDRSADDNDLELDLMFTDEEILDAMKSAARAYNSIPPLGVSSANPDRLPDNTNLFYHATAEYLFRTWVTGMRRNDMDYTAGGVAANLVRRRIEHMQNEIKEHRELWEREARDRKNYINLNRAYRAF